MEDGEYGGPPSAPPPPTIRSGPLGPPGGTWSSRKLAPRPLAPIYRPKTGQGGRDNQLRPEIPAPPMMSRMHPRISPPADPGPGPAVPRSYEAPYHAITPVVPSWDLPDKVYSCICKLVVYKDSVKAGIVELQGSNGEKAYCFFLARMVVVKSISRLADQLLVGRSFKVNARMIAEDNAIPYLASTVIPEGVEEKLLDDFRDPTPEDVEEYGRRAHQLFLALKKGDRAPDTEPATLYDQRQGGRQQQQLPAPCPAPVRLPPPQVVYPVPVPVPVPPPASSLYAPPAPMNPYITPFTIATPVPAPVTNTAGIAMAFLADREREEQAELAAEYQRQQERKVLEAQQVAQKLILAEQAKSLNQKLRSKWTTDRRTSDPEITAIDNVIANLEKEIHKQSVPSTEPVLVDKYGYVMRALPPNTLGTSATVPGKDGHSVNRTVSYNTNTNPMDYYKSMFPAPPPSASTPALPPRSGSPSSRLAPAPWAYQLRAQTNRGNMPPGGYDIHRSGGFKERYLRSRSRSRERLARERSRSPPGRERRELRERWERRRRSGSRSPGPTVSGYSRARSRSPPHRSSRGRSRRSRTKSRSRSKRGKTKSRSRSRRRLRESRSRSRSKGKEKESRRKRSEPYTGPPVPAFMLHPADRLFSGGRRRREQRRSGEQEGDMDEHKKALEATLKLIRGMQAKAGEDPEKEVNYISLEVEMLDDGQFRQFTQIGAGSEDKVTGVFNKSFFRSILPTHMAEYETNLILKNQNNLHSSLKLKFNETEASYTFGHVKKGEEVPGTEEKALKDLLSYIKKVKMDRQVVIFTHSRETLLPLLLSKLVHFDLIDQFSSAVKGFCDFTSCISKLKLGGVWKETKFSDLQDVYKHIMGKQWPREVKHSDGVAVLSGGILKKMFGDYTDYLEDEVKVKLSLTKFLAVCGFRTLADLQLDLAEAVTKERAMAVMKEKSKELSKELELRPSDRPGEITIVTLKRFECFEVLDMDEVEEEGINESDYFETEGLAVSVMEKVVVKPGFIVAVKMKLSGSSETVIDTKDTESLAAFIKSKFRGWSIVAKNEVFGGPADAIVVKEEGEEGVKQKRVLQAKRCGIARQIVEVKRELKPQTEDESLCLEEMVVMAKVLNPTDVNLELDVGDEVAVSKLEKEVDPEHPDRKTYSQIKVEAEAAARVLEEEEDARDEERRAAKAAAEKVKKKKRKKKLQNAGKKKEQNGGGSLDMDALDFEPVASDESFDEENISEDESFDEENVSEEENELITADQPAQEPSVEVIDDTVSSLSEEEAEPEAEKRPDKNIEEDGGSEKRGRSGSISKAVDRRRNKSKSRDRRQPTEKRRRSRSRSRDRRRSTEKRRRSRSRSRDRRQSTEHRRRSRSRNRSGKERSNGNSDEVGTMTYRKAMQASNKKVVEAMQASNKKAETTEDLLSCWENVTTTLKANSPLTTLQPGVVTQVTMAFSLNMTNTPMIMKSHILSKLVGMDFYVSKLEPHQDVNSLHRVATHGVSQLHVHEGAYVAREDPSSVSRLLLDVTVESLADEELHMAQEVGMATCRLMPVLGRAHFILETLNATTSIHVGESKAVKVSVKVMGDFTVEDLRGKTCFANQQLKQSDTYTEYRQIQLQGGWKMIHIEPDATGCAGLIAVVEVRVRNVTVKDLHLPKGMALGTCSSIQDPNTNNKWVHTGEAEEAGVISTSPEPAPPGEEVETVTGVPVPYSQAPAPAGSWPPSKEQLRAWSVKKLKRCLLQANLHTFGLKADIVDRLHDFLVKNPDKISSSEFETVSSTVDYENLLNTLSTVTGTVTGVQLGQDGAYYKDGRLLTVLGHGLPDTSLPPPSHSLPPPSLAANSSYDSNGSVRELLPEITEKERIVNEEAEKIMKKIGEIKYFEKKELEFFDSGMSIKLLEDVVVEARQRKIVTVRLAELDLFASELAGRRILVKERMNSKRKLTVYKQVVECSVQERKSMVEVLVENKKDSQVTIKAAENYKLIRVYVEKSINDLDHQFGIPEDDDFIEEAEEFLEKEVVDAATTTDIVLKPKTYHTEICTAKMDAEYGRDPLVQVERTKASTMRIGMRKMILVPKVLSYMKVAGGEARVSVRLYNASKSIMRISAKTPIAGLRVQKPGVLAEEEQGVKVDRKRRFGEVMVTDRYSNLRDEQVVLLSWRERGREGRKPNVVKLSVKGGLATVPLGQEVTGIREDFKVQLLRKPSP